MLIVALLVTGFPLPAAACCQVSSVGPRPSVVAGASVSRKVSEALAAPNKKLQRDAKEAPDCAKHAGKRRMIMAGDRAAQNSALHCARLCRIQTEASLQTVAVKSGTGITCTVTLTHALVRAPIEPAFSTSTISSRLFPVSVLLDSPTPLRI